MALEILTKNELDLFNSPASLNYEEKVYFFQINDTLLKELLSRYKKENIAYFILLYGYFKNFNIFYEIAHNSKPELEYIQQKYSLLESNIEIPNRTLRAYKERIKKYFNINEYTDEIRFKLLTEAISLSNNFTHRKKIFYSLVELSKKLKIEIPSYTQLSKIIQIAINNQKENITKRLSPFLEKQELSVLDEFLEKDKNYKNRWNLTDYKILEHSTNRNKIISSLTKFHTIKSKFEATRNIIESVGISPKIAR